MRRLPFLLFLIPFALSPAGCGSGNGLDLGKVQGKVLFKNEPVAGGEVIFLPDESKGTKGPQALGTIGSDGTYVMSTEESGDGAIVGVHKVGIIGHGSEPLKGDATVVTDNSSEEDVLKAKAAMGRPTKGYSGPTVRDRSGAVYALITPEKLQDPNSSGISVKVERGSNTKNILIKEDGTVTIE